MLLATLCRSPALLRALADKYMQAVLFYWTFTNLFTLLQALLLRQPAVKSLLKIPTPPPVAAAPEGESVNQNPSLLETWRALREALSTRGEAWQKAKAQAEARSAELERAKGMKKGSALMVERIKEASVAEVSSAPSASAAQESTRGRRRQRRRGWKGTRVRTPRSGGRWSRRGGSRRLEIGKLRQRSDTWHVHRSHLSTIA